MKKLLSILSAIAICALSMPATLFADTFIDIEGHDYFDAIDYVRENNIVEGYDNGTYRPDNVINRAEFTKIIIGAYFSAKEIQSCDASTLQFSDTEKNVWYSPYICLAVKNNIIEGYPDGTFRPAQTISFVEAAKIISFTDTVNDIGDIQITEVVEPWYKIPVEYLESAKSIPTSIKGFTQPVTRGEMAEIIYRIKEHITTKDSLSYEEVENGVKNGYKAKYEVGQKVGDFTVTQVDVAANTDTFYFSGDSTLTGTFENYPEDAYFSGKLCLMDLTEESKKRVPSAMSFICFTNNDEALKAFEGSLQGRVTVKISGYQTFIPKVAMGGGADITTFEGIEKIHAQLTPLEGEFNLFEHYDQHYSLKVPKQSRGVSNCLVGGTVNGEKYWTPEEGPVPVKVFADETTNLTVLAQADELELSDGQYINDMYYHFDCTRHTNTLTRVTSDEPDFGGRWNIYAEKVTNDQELESFIKKHYEPDCGLGGKTESTAQSGTYDVQIKIPPGEPTESGCFINYITQIKYSPELQMAVKWDIGQDMNFVRLEKNAQDFYGDYDSAMTESFRFLQ